MKKIKVNFFDDTAIVPIRTCTEPVHAKYTLAAIQTSLQDIILETKEIYKNNEDVEVFFVTSKLQGIVNFISDVLEREDYAN